MSQATIIAEQERGGDHWAPVPVKTDPLMTRVISFILLAGVIISAAVLACGLLLLLLTGQTGYDQGLTASLVQAHQGAVAFPTTIPAIIHDALRLRPFAVIEAGSLLLIATPVVRVGASVFLFLAEGDRFYAVVTLLVLVLLLASIFYF